MMRKQIALLYKILQFGIERFYSFYCLAILLLKLFVLNVPHGKIYTGGGVVKIRLSRRGKLIIGNNVNFANRWEIGFPNRCFLRISNCGQLKIGNNTGLNSVSIFCDDNITIGNYVHIGGGSIIFDTNFHNMDFEQRRNPKMNGICKTAPVHIENDVFIGGHSIICKGVHIGERSIIAAGSVVVKDVPSDELWGGNPAKFIKKINN